MNNNGFTSIIFLFVIATLVAVGAYVTLTENAIAPTNPEPPVPVITPTSTTTPNIVSTTTPAQDSQLLRDCPQTWYDNRMPGIVEPGQPRPVTQYFIYKGERHELTEFDMNWVKANCNLTPSVVY